MSEKEGCSSSSGVGRCDYFWPDFDRCEKVAGHDGNHGCEPPRCGAVMPGTGVLCDASVWHLGGHQSTVRWPKQSDEIGAPNVQS